MLSQNESGNFFNNKILPLLITTRAQRLEGSRRK